MSSAGPAGWRPVPARNPRVDTHRPDHRRAGDPRGVLAGTRYTAQGGAVTGQLVGARLAIRNRMEAFRAQNTALQTAAREGGISAHIGAGLLGASATGIGAAAKGIGAMGAGLRAFGGPRSALGPLDVVLIGVATLVETISVMQSAIDAHNKQIDRLQSDEGGIEGVRSGRCTSCGPTR